MKPVLEDNPEVAADEYQPVPAEVLLPPSQDSPPPSQPAAPAAAADPLQDLPGTIDDMVLPLDPSAPPETLGPAEDVPAADPADANPLPETIDATTPHLDGADIPAQAPRLLAATSPWNTQIPLSATYVEVAGVASVEAGLTSWLGANGAGASIYRALATDPLVEIRFVADTWTPVADGTWSRWGNDAATEAAILEASADANAFSFNPYSTQDASLFWYNGGAPIAYDSWTQGVGGVAPAPLFIHLPQGALPGDNSDSNTVIIQPDGRALELYSPVALSSGVWVSQMYSFTDAVNGNGTGAENGRRASMLPNYAGLLTDEDIASGHIDHALALAVPAGMLRPAFVWPALAFDAGAGGYAAATDLDAMPMGARLALPKDFDLDTLGLSSSLGWMIARAAQEYGMYIADRGGSGISILTQDNTAAPELAQWSPQEGNDVRAIISALQRVVWDDVWGTDGDDTLDGGEGLHTLAGGLGDDTYVIRNLGDRIIEEPNAGEDHVLSYVSWTLGPNLEHLTLVGTAATDGTGNAGANRLYGNSADNILSGLDGDDVLSGGGGDDTLIGGRGNDVLEGGPGRDTFIFSPGDGQDLILDFVSGQDRLVVHGVTADAVVTTATMIQGKAGLLMTYAPGDSIFLAGVEALAEGDLVLDAPSFATASALAPAVEMQSVTMQILTDTTENEILRSEDRADRIISGAGNDTLKGGGGEDVLAFAKGSGRDRITDILSAIDNLLLPAVDAVQINPKTPAAWMEIAYSAKASALRPGDIIMNGSGLDWTGGGRGQDVLRGEGGRNNSLFTPAGGQDRLLDFVSGVDRIMLPGTSPADVTNGWAQEVGVAALRLAYGIGGTVTLPAAVTAGDFWFA